MCTIYQETYQFSDKEKEIIASPEASYWLTDQLQLSAQRDILDALSDAQILAQLLQERWAKMLAKDLEGIRSTARSTPR